MRPAIVWAGCHAPLSLEPLLSVGPPQPQLLPPTLSGAFFCFEALTIVLRLGENRRNIWLSLSHSLDGLLVQEGWFIGWIERQGFIKTFDGRGLVTQPGMG